MSSPAQIFFNNLLANNNFSDFYEYFDFIKSNPIDEHIQLLSKITLQNESTPVKFHDTIRNKLIVDIDAYKNWRGKFIKLKPTYDYKGGYINDSDFIWPVVKDVFLKNKKKLEFINNDENININVQNPFPSRNEIPLLGKGSFTAVYLVEMKGEIYILRITQPDGIHLLYTDSCMDNYKNYKNNLMEIILHGNIQFIKNKNLRVYDNFLQKNISIKNFNFNYVLTKKYNVYSKKTSSILTNEQKFNLILSLLELLQKMYEKKEFHADLKIENIGWNDKMDIILIDYDEDTIVKIDSGYLFLTSQKDKNFFEIIKTSTVPPYIRNLDQKDISKYDMYSIFGVYNIIGHLQFRLKDNSYLLNIEPFTSLTDSDYSRIPKYNILIEKLKSLLPTL
jgi:hypothetical protein